MVCSVVSQSIDIRLKICGEGMPAKITAGCELCVLCGMLCRIYDIPLPEAKTTGELTDCVLSKVQPRDDKTQKLIFLLSTCQKENEEMNSDWYEVLQYGYDHC